MDKFDDNDSFWSLDSMLPPKKKTSYMQTPNQSRATDVSLSEMEIAGEPQPKCEPIPKPMPRGEAFPKPKYPPITSENKRALSFDAWLNQRREYEKSRYVAGKELIVSYKPENPLIKEIRISAEKNHRPINERFITEGMRYASLSSIFKGNVPFDSIYPQYAVLTPEQLNCFLGFRNEIFSERFPKIDRAYIYLLLYELINLTGVYAPAKRAETIASLIAGYPDCDDRLFVDMCNWLCDICMIYQLPPPKKVFGECYARVLKLASVKEFYMHDISVMDDNIMLSVLYTAGRYNYKTSTFYRQFPALYDKHIKDSCCHVLNVISKNDNLLSSYEKDVCTLTHESYFGALCTNAVRRTVEIECYCITREEKIKKLVTDLVKYSENCLRARLGIPQRLTVNTLSIDVKQLFKSYYAENVPMHSRSEKIRSKKILRDINERPEYEKLYEPAKAELDLRTASEIEQASWGITERLISAFKNDESSSVIAPQMGNNTSTIAPATEEIPIFKSEYKAKTTPVLNAEDITGNTACDIPKKYLPALELLLSENISAFNELSKAENMLPSAYADEINEALFDFIGDNAIENDGINIKLSEFYIDDIRSLLTNE